MVEGYRRGMVQKEGWVQMGEWYRRGEGYGGGGGRYRKQWNWKAIRNHEIVTVDPSENSYTSFLN
jgi:hypothetical protein